jgi:spore maturation protein CgeB
VRIGVVGQVEPDSFAENVCDALRRMGHAVTPLGPARPGVRHKSISSLSLLARQGLPALDDRFQRRIIRTAQDAACELVLNLDALMTPQTVTQLKRAGMLVVFWFPDAVVNFGRALMLLAPYDALFFKEPHVVRRLRANLDLPVHYLPEACNPRWHRPSVPAGTEPYLVLAGNMYPSRVRLLDRLIAKGIPLRLYGSLPPRWIGETRIMEVHAGQCIFREEKSRVLRAAAGVLNNLHPAELEGVNARLFEAAGSGAAVLTEYRPVVPELFTVGEELLVYEDFDELVDQASRLLNEEGLTSRLGDAATVRAHRDHSYDVRLAHVLERVA